MQNDEKDSSPYEEADKEIPTVVLPSDFHKCSRTDLIALISRMLVFLIRINENQNYSKNTVNSNGDTGSDFQPRKLTRFHSSVPPPISVYNYLVRLAKYSSIEQCVLLTSLYYIDLLSSVYKDFTLNSLTVHRFLLASTTVASKGLCDSFCTNAHYSKVGGVHCSELNILENEFLRRVNYRVIPRDDNISLCKYETGLGKFTINNDPDYNHLLTIASKRSNSGYNILSMYYHKIIQLVGKYSAATDTSRRANFVLENIEGDASNIKKTNQKRSFESTQMSSSSKHDSVSININKKSTLIDQDNDNTPHKKSNNKSHI